MWSHRGVDTFYCAPSEPISGEIAAQFFQCNLVTKMATKRPDNVLPVVVIAREERADGPPKTNTHHDAQKECARLPASHDLRGNALPTFDVPWVLERVPSTDDHRTSRILCASYKIKRATCIS